MSAVIAFLLIDGATLLLPADTPCRYVPDLRTQEPDERAIVTSDSVRLLVPANQPCRMVPPPRKLVSNDPAVRVAALRNWAMEIEVASEQLEEELAAPPRGRSPSSG